MSDIHPNDNLAALQWAVQQAQKPSNDPLAALNLSVLRQLRDEALQETRR